MMIKMIVVFISGFNIITVNLDMDLIYNVVPSEYCQIPPKYS